MTRVIDKIIWKFASALATTSKSMAHRSSFDHEPRADAVPVWMHGSARTGTTTSMNLLALWLGRNRVFEPLHRLRGPDLASVHDSMNLFLSSPRPEDEIEYVRTDGILAALQTFPGGGLDIPERKSFEAVIDAIYERYGRNSVIKEIRFFANLPALARYHEERSIPWVFIGIVANPIVPLYTFYRRGELCNRAPLKLSLVAAEYDYRLQTFELLGLFEELRSLPAPTRSDQYAVICLLDQAYLRRFVAEDPDHRRLCGLPEIPEVLGWVAERTSDKIKGDLSEVSVTKVGHGVDRWFYEDVIEKLSPPVRAAIEKQWGPISVTEDIGSIRFRKRVVSMRHRAFTD